MKVENIINREKIRKFIVDFCKRQKMVEWELVLKLGAIEKVTNFSLTKM